MKGYIQLTPVPEELDHDINVLEQIARAVDGLQDQVDARKEFVAQERSAFRKWSGLAEGTWQACFLRGYPTLFLCFAGPYANDDNPKLPIEQSLNNFVSALSADVVYGDIGCVLSGVPFSSRARWEVADEKQVPIAVTHSDGSSDITDDQCIPVQSKPLLPTVEQVALIICTIGAIIGALAAIVIHIT